MNDLILAYIGGTAQHRTAADLSEFYVSGSSYSNIWTLPYSLYGIWEEGNMKAESDQIKTIAIENASKLTIVVRPNARENARMQDDDDDEE